MVVWSSGLLRDLDARGRKALVHAGRLRRVPAGADVFGAREPADRVFVITQGAVDLWPERASETAPAVSLLAGDTFGEEALLEGADRWRGGATAARDTEVAELPAALLRRLLDRGDTSPWAARIRRSVERSVALERLRVAPVGARLDADARARVLDAAEHVRLVHGQPLGLALDHDAPVHFVVRGALAREGAEGRRIAYAGEGAVVDAHGLHPVLAEGGTWLLAIPRACVDGWPDDARALVVHRGAPATGVLAREAHRLRAARSLLVIQEDACVRCGQCVAGCGDAHADGIARFARRGEAIDVRVEGQVVPVLAPNACHHCDRPACLDACPVAAIGRDADGHVQIDPSRCTGCGACAKACAWGNVAIVPRAAAAPGDAITFAHVAVKCDHCRERKDGPACVAACPVDAIARVDPGVRSASEAFPALAVPRAGRPSARAWVVAGAFGAVLACVVHEDAARSGVVGGALFLALAFHGVVTRLRRSRPLGRRIAAWAHAHVALGAGAASVFAVHVGARVPANLAGALTLAVVVATTTGAFGALAYRLAPPRLARLTRVAALPEDHATRRRALDDATYRALSGANAALKTAYARFLRPYARAWGGGLALALRDAGTSYEERRLRARIDAALGGHASARLDGLPVLVRCVVARRALDAERVLETALRVWRVPHVVSATVAALLLIAHVVAVLAYR